MKNFWQKLNKPFLVLAPMDDVTDTVFREIVNKAAAPDVTFTEFANTDGYVHPKGAISVRRKLRVNDSERELGVPLIAQIWGGTSENYYKTAKDLAATGLYAGIDINMGCPEKGIVKRGCCGGLIKPENWQNAADIIAATKKGAGQLPVSVKTRIGVNGIVTEEWATYLLQQDIAALTIHGRTVKEMSKVPAHWDEIGKVVKIRDKIAPQTIIIGNGDVESRKEGIALSRKYGCEGIMIGRGVFKNLHIFSESSKDWAIEDRLQTLLEHVNLYEQTWGDSKSYDPLKKFFKVYLNGFADAANIRARFMETKSPAEARELVRLLQSADKNLVGANLK